VGVPDRFIRRDRSGTIWIDLEYLLGSRRVPLPVAQVIARAVRTMEEQDDLSPNAKWQALEWWAADYLAGADPIHAGADPTDE